MTDTLPPNEVLTSIPLRRALRDGSDTLEQALSSISKFGHPTLLRTNEGWYCLLEMFINVAGVSFKVTSNVGHGSPLAAVNLCSVRVNEVLTNLNL